MNDKQDAQELALIGAEICSEYLPDDWKKLDLRTLTMTHTTAVVVMGMKLQERWGLRTYD